jgi:hypothetical protein
MIKGALGAPLLFVLAVADPHNETAIERQCIQIERETFAVACRPCHADVCPAGVFAITVDGEKSVARAVLIPDSPLPRRAMQSLARPHRRHWLRRCPAGESENGSPFP